MPNQSRAGLAGDITTVGDMIRMRMRQQDVVYALNCLGTAVFWKDRIAGDPRIDQQDLPIDLDAKTSVT